MAKKYRFDVGDKVRIRALPCSSMDVKENDGKIVTIKARCKFTWAYTLEEFGDNHLWQDDCFEHVRIKYATCAFNRATGQVCDDDGSLEWHDATLCDAMQQVKNGSVGCALFFPRDLRGYGHPLCPEITRAQFEAEPAIFGVCYYKSCSGYVFE